MVVTEVRIKLVQGGGNLLAFASITFDDMFVVRDLKLIEGQQGMFAAMPSRKLTDRCPRPRCGKKNPLDQRYCGACCKLLGEDRAPLDEFGRRKTHADIAHPINSAGRQLIETAMITAYHAELALSAEPGYVCAYDLPYANILAFDGEELMDHIEARHAV
jgi:stage V sporulation protein G